MFPLGCEEMGGGEGPALARSPEESVNPDVDAKTGCWKLKKLQPVGLCFSTRRNPDPGATRGSP